MKAVILCGGKGTRLREETEFRPKPMVEIGGRPILWHIMKTYAHFGVTDFILCIGYKGEMIKDYFLNYEPLNNDFTIRLGSHHEIEFHNAHMESNWRVTLADTGEDTQTAGRLRRIRKYIGSDERFFVTYGDGVANIDLNGALEFHKRQGRLATVTTVQPPSRFGLLEVDQDGTVSSFAEKAAVHGWINGGYFIFENAAFSYFDDDQMLEQEPLTRLTKDQQLASWQHHGFWQPMDTFRETTLLNEMWDAGRAPWRVWSDDESDAGQGSAR